MSVVCAVCKTENRDNAMFCHGCAGKLPAFNATGPSALEAMRVRRPAPGTSPGAGPSSGSPRAMLPTEMPGTWVRVALLTLALALGFVGWYAYVTRKVPPRAQAPATMLAAPPARTEALAKPPDSVPLLSSLAAGEIQVEPGLADTTALAASATPLPATERAQPPRAARIARAEPMDPRRGCENMNFIFAARCEASHCDNPAYSRHPRCDLVREQRRRDEARRNPTLGY